MRAIKQALVVHTNADVAIMALLDSRTLEPLGDAVCAEVVLEGGEGTLLLLLATADAFA